MSSNVSSDNTENFLGKIFVFVLLFARIGACSDSAKGSKYRNYHVTTSSEQPTLGWYCMSNGIGWNFSFRLGVGIG